MIWYSRLRRAGCTEERPELFAVRHRGGFTYYVSQYGRWIRALTRLLMSNKEQREVNGLFTLSTSYIRCQD